jgi:hypothetical protein
MPVPIERMARSETPRATPSHCSPRAARHTGSQRSIFVHPSASFQPKWAESPVYSAVNLQPLNAVNRFWSHALRRWLTAAQHSGQVLIEADNTDEQNCRDIMKTTEGR